MVFTIVSLKSLYSGCCDDILVSYPLLPVLSSAQKATGGCKKKEAPCRKPPYIVV